ncbi:MAG: tetratricopeptide repeat protein [Pirellulaceae bacterium]|nr:tetratricopeptide repeat protein [Pirellulaceae bacterium]
MATEIVNLQRALKYFQAGELAESEKIYRRIVQINSQEPTALHMLGIIAFQRQEYGKAIEWITKAIFVSPSNADFYSNLGLVLQSHGQLESARNALARSLSLQPNSPEAQNNYGNVLKDLGDYHAAATAYQTAIQLQPQYAEAYSNLGVTLQKFGQLDDSVLVLQRAIQLQPSNAISHFNLGISFQKLGNVASCIQEFLQAIQLRPEYPEAYYSLGHAYMDSGKLDEAIVAFQRTIQLRPNHALAYSNLGMIHQDRDEFESAIASHRRALELSPDSAETLVALTSLLQQACQWEDVERFAIEAIQAVDRTIATKAGDYASPFSFLGLIEPTTAEQQFHCAQKWVQGTCTIREQVARPVTESVARRPDRKIKLGYLSADFHSHATAWLMAEMLESHSRDRFEVFGYSFGPDDATPMRQRIITAFDCFREVRPLDFRKTAEQIAADGIDILVDLKGFTRHARTPIMAFRPAPIQVNYLGYPGTMGAEFIDYIIVDDYIVPPEQQAFYSERLVHLPGCYQVNDSQREISQSTPTRQACGLPEQGMVFCSFNNCYKFSPKMFDVWMTLLKNVPGSVLWLLESSRLAKENLSQEASKRAISTDRIVFAPKLPLAEHLARHRLADLFLDSFPVNAHTTASDALQAGLPLVTLSGNTFISRVAGSLLRAVGLEKLIANSFEEYESLALRLAQQPAELSLVRTQLGELLVDCELFNGSKYAKKIELAYEKMWERYISGRSPEAFKIDVSE